MSTAAEALLGRAQGLRSSSLKRPLYLRRRELKVSVDPDGAVRSFDSLAERRALFGYEQLWFCKVQAGIVVHAQKQDWMIRPSPRSLQLSGKVFDGIEAVESVEFFRGQSLGYVRRLKLRNGGEQATKLRVFDLADPTGAHLGDTSARWGSMGVNAFNRESHVAMDEVSDPPSARVVGTAPSPSKIYMTTDKARAQQRISSGELPEATAGMSGQVLVVFLHELELQPGEAKELTYAFIYNGVKLEDALSDFGRLQSGEIPAVSKGPMVACSERAVTEAAAWALPAIEGGAFAENALDRYEVLGALTYVDPTAARRVLDETRPSVRKDGSLPHSMDPTRPGVLETAVFLRGAAAYLVLSQDKKLARTYYPLLKKLAGYLLAASKDLAIQTDPGLPQGWRRSLGRGYPTGEIPEVSLAAAGALAGASQVVRMLAKPRDAGPFIDRATMLVEQVRKKLLDERGFLALCRDSSGRLRNDETIDMAVAVYRYPSAALADHAAAHRLLEKDFDTPYGPRCVPTTNQVYFNRAYGNGQLGGVWIRAALAHASVCYRAGLVGVGGLGLRKVAKLVTDDSPRLGGSPGGFPEWVDVDGGVAHGEEGDPVAAARFLETFLEGEFGLSMADRASYSPPAVSNFNWLMASDIWVGEQTTLFIGRASGRSHLFTVGGHASPQTGMKFAKSDRLDLSPRGVYGVTFYSPGQVICLGNSTSSPAKFTVNFAPKAADLSKHLSTPLESYDPSSGSWAKAGTLRVFPTMAFEESLEPNGWKAFRVSTA